jgi:hypothetical protein
MKIARIALILALILALLAPAALRAEPASNAANASATNAPANAATNAPANAATNAATNAPANAAANAPANTAAPNPPPAATLTASRPLRMRKTAIGLLIGGGACLALGAVFAILASNAAGDAVADMQFHPQSSRDVTSYEVADGAFFLAGGAAVVSGLVLLW